MADPFIAEIRIFAGNFAPREWARCDGATLQIAQNTALFSLIGTTYGGDGETTTRIPDLKGRAPMHAGRGAGLTERRQGQQGGVTQVVLNESQTGPHSHRLQATSDDRNSTDPAGRVLATTDNDFYADPPAVAAQTMATSTTNTGGGQAHTNLQPYLTLLFIIALQGTYPSRS